MEVVEVEVGEVGEVAVFGASAPLSLETDVLRLGSRTSLPDWNMKRRSCHVGEDMMVVVDDCLVSSGWLELCFEVCLKCWRGRKGIVSLARSRCEEYSVQSGEEASVINPKSCPSQSYHVVQRSCRDAKCNDMAYKIFHQVQSHLWNNLKQPGSA